MNRALPSFAVLLLLAGCAPKAEQGNLESSDIRIDQANTNNDPESEHTRMCVNDSGEIFVIWVDDRDGKDDVWLNRSLDAGRSWLPAAVRVNDFGQGVVENPDIACTGERVYVVWEDDRDGELQNHNIYFSRSEDKGESWSVDQRLDPDEEGYNMSRGPQVVAAGSQVYVAWFDNMNGAYDVLVQASNSLGDTWQEDPLRADGDGPGESYSAWPKIVTTAGGDDLYIVWTDSRSGASDIYFAHGSWDQRFVMGPDHRIDTGDSKGQYNSFEPTIGADGDVVYVAWHDERSGAKRDIFMNYTTDFGANWLDVATRVDGGQPGLFDSLLPQLVVRGETAHIVWEDAATESGGYDIQYRKAVAGRFDAEPTRLDTDPVGYANSIDTQIALGDDGIVVAWQDGRDDPEKGYDDLYYNFSRDGGKAWSDTDLRIDAMEPGQAYKVDLNLALHRQELLVAWTDGRNGTSDIYFQHLKVGSEVEYTVTSVE